MAADLERPDGLYPRSEGGSEGSEPALRRQRARDLRLARSRRNVDRPAARTAAPGRRRSRRASARQRPGDCHACARVLHLDDITPLQQMAAGRVAGSAPVLFPPMPAVRYTPASDTSVLGNRVWVARNQPYGAILNYYLPEAAASGVTFTILDRTGRTIATFPGAGAKGVNRTSWNLSEVSSCGPAATGGRGGGRGGRGGGGGGGGGGTWVRAIPGDYTVRLAALGTTAEQRVTVRRDPRVPATTNDTEVWYSMAQKIEKTECTLDRALADLAEVERILASRPNDAATEALRRELRPVILALRGDPKDPGHVNLPARMNWLTIQVGNNSNAPTAAQLEWIGKYSEQTASAIAKLDEIKAKVGR